MATQETIKQIFSGGTLRDVEDTAARQLAAQLQTAIDAITGGDTTTAIKTFQEVIDFLDGVTDDATLVGKLNELRTLINAKYSKPASGIPANDLADGVIPDVSGFATKSEVNAKANTADVYTKAQTDAAIQEAVEDLGGGTVESVTVNGTKHTPDANGDVDLGNLRGQDGNSGVASADGVESVNNLNGGTTDTSSRVYVLGANQGKRLRDQIDYVYARLQVVYAALGNIAFWDGKIPIANILPDLD